MSRTILLRAACLAAAGALAPALAQDRPLRLADLADMSLEQLTRVTVTSAARREQPLLEAPASLFVITGEDIRRSGFTSLPEVLRLAPNLQVMRGDTSQYVISARGALTSTANKMLVLIDGRTVYTPLFSGVFYDALTPLIEDIERIEVISGPGATLWGTNAVNGVINVTTRKPSATRGTLLAAGAGDAERGVSVRQGWALGTDGAMRIHARFYDHDARELQAGGGARDDATRWQAGFRAERENADSTFNLQGLFYAADVNNLGGARDLSGGHLIGRWNGSIAGANATVQGYYDRTERVHTGTFEEVRDTFDVEAQVSARTDRHMFTAGGGLRSSRDRTVPTPALGFMPAERTLRLFSLYAQDEFRVLPNLVAIAGLRAEHNDYTDWEILPSVRVSYSVSPETVLWGAVSRAVRTPSRIDADLVVPGFPPFRIVNNPRFAAEVAEVAEMGYRGRLGRMASVSLSAFFHRYDRLRTVEPAGAASTLSNGAEGRTSGIEAWGDVRPTENWRLVWGVTQMRHKTEVSAGRVNIGEDPLGNNPRRTASLRSLLNVGERFQLDLFARYVGSLRAPALDSYTQLSARVGYRVTPQLELSLTGSNLLDEHAEFGAPAARATFGHSYFAKATWSF